MTYWGGKDGIKLPRNFNGLRTRLGCLPWLIEFMIHCLTDKFLIYCYMACLCYRTLSHTSHAFILYFSARAENMVIYIWFKSTFEVRIQIFLSKMHICEVQYYILNESAPPHPSTSHVFISVPLQHHTPTKSSTYRHQPYKQAPPKILLKRHSIP